ncbi:Glutamate receptor ionotropic, kainate 5 [Manis javanica]|nr:Glutamate receptor ionotropic, kainate 5 [Manis javanica]
MCRLRPRRSTRWWRPLRCTPTSSWPRCWLPPPIPTRSAPPRCGWAEPRPQARGTAKRRQQPGLGPFGQVADAVSQCAGTAVIQRSWTTALGKAYYNDPADVMNAIQVMRQRVLQGRHAQGLQPAQGGRGHGRCPPPCPSPHRGPVGEPLSSMLPVPVIDTPPQFIEIAPAQPDTVYVPQYDPGVVYGEPVPMYGGYRPIVAPQPVYVGSSAAPVVAGLIGFGAGVILAESVDRRPWGWNSWGMRWGEPGYRWHRNEPPPPPSRRPAVIYNNNTYVSRSTTVVQNIHNTRINNVGNVTNIANNPHFEPRRPDFPQQGGDPRPGDPRSGDPRFW